MKTDNFLQSSTGHGPDGDAASMQDASKPSARVHSESFANADTEWAASAEEVKGAATLLGQSSELGQQADSASGDSPKSGTVIEHFRIIRQLGQGGMGQVLLARDTRLGRLVALKLIRSDLTAQGHSIDLMGEARAIARLSHPNIVTIHHVGLFGQSPYLALEYVEGVSLRRRLREAPPSQIEALRIARAIAMALESAHATGVIHCDLKPENVLLPPDGRVRVVDFGIAQVLESQLGDAKSQPGRITGTPAYMAPEQWLDLAPTAATDLWALGVLLYEMLAGHRPFDGTGQDKRPLQMRVLDEGSQPAPLADLTPALQTLLGDLLARVARNRPSAGDVVARLDALLDRPTLDPQGQESPFRGLFAFEEQHAACYFGRGADVDAAMERLRTVTVLPVVGQSGTGKSSFVQAGLLPRLREQGPLLVLPVRPGSQPLLALAFRLLHSEVPEGAPAGSIPREAVERLAQELLLQPGLANVHLHGLAEQTQKHVLLFVDQLEEVVTQGCQPHEAQAFLQAVVGAADAVDESVRVVLTLRDDFLGQLAQSPALAATLGSVLVLRRLDDRQLREAALRPLQAAQYSWDDAGVVDRMVTELTGQPAALPLLQFTCAMLWERRDRDQRQLKRAEYEAVRGVAGALASHAEAVFEGLAPSDLRTARKMLLRLVTAAGTRQSAPRQILGAGLGPRAQLVLERLITARLLVVRRSADGGEDQSLVELVHESLLHTWPQLVRWLEESSEQRAIVGEIEAATRLWLTRGRRGDEAWPLDSVTAARSRLHGDEDVLSPQATEFLAISQDLGSKRRRRRRTLISTVAAAMALITLASVLVAAELARRERTTRLQSERLMLAAADLGYVRLQIGVVDWDAQTQASTPVLTRELPNLRWSLHEVDRADPTGLGPSRDGQFVRVRNQQLHDQKWQFDIETRSGPAVLLVSGRGRAREDCPPARVNLQSLPGFATRSATPVNVAVVVPSCKATAAQTLEIAAGPFWHGGPGEPEVHGHLPPIAMRREELPAFRLDKTESSNAWYRVYGRNSAWTGDPPPTYPPEVGVPDASLPDHPVTSIDYYTAAAFCGWQGKRLPTSLELTKAARGGWTLDAEARQANPLPKRNFPWGQDDPKQRMNLADTPDPWPASAPVQALPQGASPYGALALADNVAEWTSSTNASDVGQALRVIRGSQWSLGLADGMYAIDVENTRHPRFFSFDLGVRCVLPSSR